MTEMAAQRDPLLHFSAAAAAVNTLLLRTGQGYPKIAQEGREEGGPTDRPCRNHSSHETDIVLAQSLREQGRAQVCGQMFLKSVPSIPAGVWSTLYYCRGNVT